MQLEDGCGMVATSMRVAVFSGIGWIGAVVVRAAVSGSSCYIAAGRRLSPSFTSVSLSRSQLLRLVHCNLLLLAIRRTSPPTAAVLLLLLEPNNEQQSK